MKKHAPFLILSTSLVALWELLVSLEILPESLFPAPHMIVQSLLEDPALWWQAGFETTRHAALGLFLSLILGSSLSFLLILISPLKKAVLPLAVFFQTVPIIAIAPLLVIYFGFGAPTVIASSCIVSFFPVLASFLLGLENVDKPKLELFKLYGASPVQTLFKLRLPSAFLPLYGGLKVAVGLSLIGAVAGEFVAGTGLGAVIDSARTQQRTELVFASLLLLSLLGLLGLGLLKIVFQSLHFYRPFGENSEEFRHEN